MNNIVSKIREANLLGRSGSMFPVAAKWEAVKTAEANEKYVICNASEGELETFKDYFILKNHLEAVVAGIKIATEEIGAKKAYIYLNKDYYDEISPKIKELVGDEIEVVKKRGGYVGGEETSVIEAIEGNEPWPRIKPPFPAQEGLFGLPTLVNNVETFYCVSKIARDDYNNERFFSIGGDAPNKGVFLAQKNTSVSDLLEETQNNPSFDFFVQIGGGAGGLIFLKEELSKKNFDCLGSVVIYDKEKTDPYLLMEKWVNFLMDGNCDKCTPCREGLYRIEEMVKSRDFSVSEDIFFVMKSTSLCPLGRVAVNPFLSLLNKIILKDGSNN